MYHLGNRPACTGTKNGFCVLVQKEKHKMGTSVAPTAGAFHALSILYTCFNYASAMLQPCRSHAFTILQLYLTHTPAMLYVSSLHPHKKAPKIRALYRGQEKYLTKL